MDENGDDEPRIYVPLLSLSLSGADGSGGGAHLGFA
jgi:hypothetical protein